MAAQVDEIETRSGETLGGGWLLGRLLGSGGMASVYEATDASGRRAAIKLLHPEMVRRRELKERFLREAYVANRIEHPGVVKILEHVDERDVFLVVELLEGVPLSARIAKPGELTVRELLEYADQILDALAAAHRAGVVHRDIKPDNVFLTRDRGVKVLDFGIARVIDDVPSEVKTRTGIALGTIPYMAPEQALGRRGKVDGRTDLFALGALLFRALAGRRIHEEPSEAELLVAMATKPAPRLASVAPNVPPRVCAIVDRALAFSQDARYPDAATMQTDVRALLAGEVPAFAVGAAARADEATRVEATAIPSTVPMQDAATLATAAPASLLEPTLESPGVGATPAAFASEPVPMSMPPQSLAGAQVSASAAPSKQRGGLIAAAAAAGLAAFGVVLVGAILLWFRPWESAPAPATSAAADVPSADTSGEVPRTETSAQAPAATATAKATAAKPAPARIAPSTALSSAPAPTSSAAVAPTATGTVAPKPTTTGTSTAAPSPTGATTPPPSEDKGKGKGHDKDKGKPNKPQ